MKPFVQDGLPYLDLCRIVANLTAKPVHKGGSASLPSTVCIMFSGLIFLQILLIFCNFCNSIKSFKINAENSFNDIILNIMNSKQDLTLN